MVLASDPPVFESAAEPRAGVLALLRLPEDRLHPGRDRIDAGNLRDAFQGDPITSVKTGIQELAH